VEIFDATVKFISLDTGIKADATNCMVEIGAGTFLISSSFVDKIGLSGVKLYSVAGALTSDGAGVSPSYGRNPSKGNGESRIITK
jgi:hypothetical protein